MFKLCSCPASNKCMRYRYTLDELPALITNLRNRVKNYEQWNRQTTTAFQAKGSDRICENLVFAIMIE